MTLRPTEEQLDIIDAFEADYDLVIEAGAGTGKSSTLKMLGSAKPNDHGLYLAFNRAVAEQARASFPFNMQCATVHSIAYRALGRQFEHRLNAGRVTAKATAEHLNIRKWFRTPGTRKDISSWKLASLAMDTVRRYCQSDDDDLGLNHVPYVHGVQNMHELREAVLPFAFKAWADVTSFDGVLRFTPDHYLKMWALGEPLLSCDFLCVDEAQDTNGVVAGIVRRQVGKQKILVGDANQQLFAWRGAQDIMKTFDCDERLLLTLSFRFGPEIAAEANRWLQYLDDVRISKGEKIDQPLRLRGLDSIESKLTQVSKPNAVLCRTNADVIGQALNAQERGVKVGIVGGVEGITNLASAVQDLKRDGKTSHPDLAIFKTWDDVLAYVKEEQPDGSFGTFMRLVENYGEDKIIKIAGDCVHEDNAELVVSTVHKVKGLEWDTVAVDGAIIPEGAVDLKPADLMVAYVAATRAKHELDVTALEGFHEHQQRLRDAAQKRSAARAARSGERSEEKGADLSMAGAPASAGSNPRPEEE